MGLPEFPQFHIENGTWKGLGGNCPLPGGVVGIGTEPHTHFWFWQFNAVILGCMQGTPVWTKNVTMQQWQSLQQRLYSHMLKFRYYIFVLPKVRLKGVHWKIAKMEDRSPKFPGKPPGKNGRAFAFGCPLDLVMFPPSSLSLPLAIKQDNVKT